MPDSADSFEIRRILLKLEEIQRDQQAILALLRTQTQQGETIMADLTQLTKDVAAEKTAIDSTVTLLNGLSAALKAAGTDPVALAALDAQIVAHTKSLSDAVVANTPAVATAKKP